MLCCHEQVVYAVLQVLNLITDDNVELLEGACHAGLVSHHLFGPMFPCSYNTSDFVFLPWYFVIHMLLSKYL